MTITVITRSIGTFIAVTAAFILSHGTAAADAVGDFYNGKSIRLIISTGAGGGQDQTARIVGRHWTNHIPGNPTFVPTNMPGGGHLLATNHLYNVAPKDGTAVGAIIPSIVMHQVLGRKGVQYDAAKFQWIGSSTLSNSMVFVWHTAGVKTIEDAKAKSIIMGGTGAASNSVRYPAMLNNVLGTKFRVIMGYRSTNQADLAMERGEVQGRAGATFNTMLATQGEWIKTGKINILAQIGPAKEPGFENIPLVTELAKDKASRDVLQVFCDDIGLGRPFMVAPGVPADRVSALRTSFDATMKDPALLADAKKARLDISPTSGDKIQKLVENMIHLSPDVLTRVKAALETKGAIAGKPKGAKGGKKKKKKESSGG
jgi:tripartite-type tricarboxylate transporter receptor subunit TctC